MSDEVTTQPAGDTAQPVNVKTPSGEIVSLPGTQVPDALEAGYTQPSTEEVNQYFKNQDFGTLPQMGLTALEGASDLIPGAPALETKLGLTTPENRAARAETNPLSGLAGNIAGVAGLEYATAGMATPALEGELGGGILSKIGQYTARNLAVPEAAARALGETGAISGVHELNRYFGDPDKIAEFQANPAQAIGNSAVDVGLSGLIGGVLGGGLGAAGSALSKLSGEGSEALGASSKVLSDAKAHLEKLESGFGDKEAGVNALKELHDSVSNITGDIYGESGLKTNAIAQNMHDVNPEHVTNQASELYQSLGDKIREMQKEPDIYPVGLVKQLSKQVDTIGRDIPDAASGMPGAQVSSEFFDAMNRTKQLLQSYSKPGMYLDSTDIATPFIKEIRTLTQSFKNGLEDTNVWGKVGQVQQDANKAFSEFKRATDNIVPKFTVKNANKEQIFDPDKAMGLFNKFEKGKGAVQGENLSTYLDKVEDLQNTLNGLRKSQGIPEVSLPNAELIKNAMGAADKSLGGSLAEALHEWTQKSVIPGSLDQIGAVGAHALSPSFTAALLGKNALLKTLGTIGSKALSALPESVEGLSAAGKLIRKSEAGASALTQASRAVFDLAKMPSVSLSPSVQKIAGLDDQLKQLRAQPESLIDATNPTAHYLASHGQALSQTVSSASAYLNSIRPSEDKSAPLDSQPKISAFAKDNYNRALEIAQNPLVVMRDVKNGTITPQDMTHLSHLYPALLDNCRNELVDSLASVKEPEKIPYATKMGLSLLLGQPLDSTLTPQGLQRLKLAGNLMTKSQQEQNAAPGKVTASGGQHLDKLASSFRTPMQALQADKGF